MEQATDYIIEELKMTKAELKKYKDQELEDKRIKTLYALRIDDFERSNTYEYIERLEKMEKDLEEVITNPSIYFDTKALLADLFSLGYEINPMPYLQTIFFVGTMYALAFEGSCLHLVVVDDRYISKEMFHVLNFVKGRIHDYIEENKVR